MTKTLNDITPAEWDSLSKPHKDMHDPIDFIDVTDEEFEAILVSKDDKLKARKDDVGKLPMDLIPPEAERMEAEVLAHGLKYGPHNWRGGLQYSRLIAALMRHFSAWRMGEDLDPESGLSHMAHVRAISGFLCTFIAEDRIDLDNRYRKEVK